MNKGVIYGYKDILNNKIVYIGQSTNLKERHYRHVKHDPTNELLLEYEYPLSRGIRKYGEENYELVVLEENIEQNNLNEREIYYITKYNTYEDGYNQTLGGQLGKYNIYKEEEVELVRTMLKTKASYKEISEASGISLPHISNINTGSRCPKDGISYPIRDKNQVGTRGRKFSLEQIKEILELLSASDLSQSKIATIYGVSKATIYHINHGRRYHQEGVVYPIRQS